MKPIINEKIWRKSVRVESIIDSSSDCINLNAKDINELNSRSNKAVKDYITRKPDCRKTLQEELYSKKIYLDLLQPIALKRYWSHEFLKNPTWDEITIESYYVNNCLILWAWKGPKPERLYPAVFIKMEGLPQSKNFLEELSKALFKNNDSAISKVTAYYLVTTFKAVEMDLYKKPITDTTWMQIADILFSCDYKVYPYIKGHLCNSLPLPASKINYIDEERIISGPSVVSALEELSGLWNNSKAKNIYISGSPGAGKEGYCKAIHYGKGRQGVFETIDMTNQSEEQIQIQVFGEITSDGAIIPGSINKAENGTLFLDEINKSNYNIRSMLLRPLESKVYYPFRSSHPKKIEDVVFVLASPDKLSEVREKSHSRDKDEREKYGPPDLWSRVQFAVHVEHPFSIPKDSNSSIDEIIENLFYLSWINSFCVMMDVDFQTINSILYKTKQNHTSSNGHDYYYQPHELAIANSWQRYVYDITLNSDEISEIKVSDILKQACKEFVEIFKSKGKGNLQDCSIREFQSAVNEVANSVYNFHGSTNPGYEDIIENVISTRLFPKNKRRGIVK